VIALGTPYVAHRADDGRAAPRVAPADEASPEQRRAGARAVSMTSSRKPFADTRARRGPHHSAAAHIDVTAARADDDLASHIRDAAARYGVPERLVTALIAEESQFNPRAVSRRGAIGLMQLMPQTAELLGVRDSYDPLENLDAGVRYLRELLDRFDNNLPLVLAAYNAGEKAVVEYRGVPPYPETRDYISRVLQRVGDAAAPSARRPLAFSRKDPVLEVTAMAMSSPRRTEKIERPAPVDPAPPPDTDRPPLREPAALPVALSAPPSPPPRSGLAAFARKLRETVSGDVASTPERRDSAVQAP